MAYWAWIEVSADGHTSCDKPISKWVMFVRWSAVYFLFFDFLKWQFHDPLSLGVISYF